MESLESRARIVMILLVLIIGFDAVGILSEMSMTAYLTDIQRGAVEDETRAAIIDMRQAVIGVIQILLLITCGITFLLWFHRAHKNLGSAGLSGLEYSPRWATGGFFVPILNWYRPFQVMREVWRGSAFLSRTSSASNWNVVRTSPLVILWWGLFVFSGSLGSSSFRFSLADESLPELLSASYASIGAQIVDIPAAIVAILLVQRITEFQEKARKQPTGHAMAIDDRVVGHDAQVETVHAA